MSTVASTRHYPAQFSLVYILTPYFSCIHLNIIYVFVSQVTPQSHTAACYTTKPACSGTARDRIFLVAEIFRVTQVLDVWIRWIRVSFSLRQAFYMLRFRLGQVSLYRWMFCSTVISQHVTLSVYRIQMFCFLTVSSGLTKVLKPIVKRMVSVKDS